MAIALSARENRTKTGFLKDASDLGAFISLDLDLAILDCATSAACPLHRLGQFLLFRKSDADEVLDNRYGLAAAPSFYAENVHPASNLARRFGSRSLPGINS